MMAQTQFEVLVKKGKVLELQSEYKDVRITMVEAGSRYWHAIIRISTHDYIKEDYAVLDYDWNHYLDIGRETGEDVLSTLAAALCCGKIETREETVYYANVRGLDLFYFASQKLVYIVDREGDAHELGGLNDAVYYAKDVFEGEDLQTVERFVEQVKDRLSI